MTTLEWITNHNIKTRHQLVCSKQVARESIAALRRVRNQQRKG